MLTVKLQLGGVLGRLDESSPRLLIGRDPDCGMISQDGTISRHHAEVFLEKNQVFIRDFGSANGTWVDGVAVKETPVVLKPGQQVFVGHVLFVLEWQGSGAQDKTMVGEVPSALKAAALKEALDIIARYQRR